MIKLSKSELKITLLIVLLGLSISVITFAQGRTRHTDYATAMSIKECNACHLVNNVEPNHGIMWMKEHRILREKLPSNCNDCHQQSFCYDCHIGGGIDRDLHSSGSGVNYTPKTHRSDYREIHPIKAKDDVNSCYRCHDRKRFCSDCHSKVGNNNIMLESHRKQFSNISLSSVGPKHETFTSAQCKDCHIQGILPRHEWSRAHAREARKNISSCQACHFDGDTCMKCHSAKTGLKVSPHPKNWNKIAGRLKAASGNKTCVKCH